MKTLILMRHARKEKAKKNRKKERSLGKRGQKDALLMAGALLEKELNPQVILSSTALAARQTAATAVEKFNFTGEVLNLDKLKDGGVKDYIKALQAVDDAADRVLLVGHMPALRALIKRLTKVDQRFPTGAVAHLSLPIQHWLELSKKTECDLIEFYAPKDLS